MYCNIQSLSMLFLIVLYTQDCMQHQFNLYIESPLVYNVCALNRHHENISFLLREDCYELQLHRSQPFLQLRGQLNTNRPHHVRYRCFEAEF